MEEITGGQLDRITTKIVEEASQQGDPLAKELWVEMEEALGLAVANLVTLFNPERIVLGGGVIEGSPSLIKTTEHKINQWVSLPSKEEVKVLKAELGADAGVIGATLLPVDPEDL
jgi:glucokinase